MGNRRIIILSFVLLALAVPPLAHAEGPEALPIGFGPGGVNVGATSVFTKAVDSAAYDAAQDLIWFTSKGSLHVLDLRKASSKAVVIAKKMPEGGFAITGLSNADSGNTYAGVYPVLALGKKNKVGTGEGAYGGIWEDQDKTAKKAIKKIKITGTKWLKAQAKRKPHDVPAAFSDEVVGTVKLPTALAACEDETLCGEARGFGGTRLQLVLAEHSCGDACHTGCVLYDPASKKFASPLEAGTWGMVATPGGCFDYEFSPDGRTYLNGKSQCTVDKAVSCIASEDWTYVAWVAADVAAGYGLLSGTSGGAAASPEAEKALVELVALRDRACQCKDKACVDKLMVILEGFAKKYENVVGSDEQTARGNKTAEEMTACMIKRM